METHEGHKLRQTLADRGKTLADLARAAQVIEQAVQKWVNAGKMGAKARETATRGLAKMGIDTSKMWEIQVVAMGVLTHDNAAERRRLLDRFDPEQLAAIKRLLEGTDRDREIVLAVIDDRLNRK